MANREVTSFCRICGGGCGVRLTLDGDDRIVSIRGDKDAPLSRGYVCFKGLQAEEAHHGPERLLHPLKRMPDGSFRRIGLQQALDEIGERLEPIIERDGPDAFGIYVGGGSAFNAASLAMQTSFMAAMGSSQLYSTLTIDQSAKVVSFERLGGWAAGLHDLDESEAVLLFGVNPLVSHGLSILASDPTRRIKRARERGLKLICVDPRLTETAHHADLFLQPAPGQDVAIAAGLIRLILTESWHDAAFCARHVGPDRLARLRAAVEPFMPERVERRAGLPAGQLRLAAEMFASRARKGSAFAATGTCMAPFGNTAMHLVDCINVICGRFKRPGDRILTDMVGAERPIHAEVIAPPRSWEAVPKSRIRGVGRLAGERLTSTLAEEILTPGEGRIKSFFVVGANPALGIPDQRRIVEALRSLDLLVTVDPFMTETARLSHYVLPSTMPYERPDLSLSLEGYSLFPANWIQYTPAVLKTPPGAEVIEEARFFWEVASRLDRTILFNGKVALDKKVPPTSDDFLAIRLMGSRFTLDELRRHPSGLVVDLPVTVQEPRPGADARFDVMPADVAEEIAQFLAHDDEPGRVTRRGRTFTHLLSNRRMGDVFCSTGRNFSAVRRRTPFNPAHLNPDDLATLGVTPGDRIAITSDYGRIEATAQADKTLRRGVVSLSHGWGTLPGDGEDGGEAVCVNLLVSSDRDVAPVNAMPRMSAIPVNIELVMPSRDAAEPVSAAPPP